MVNKLFSLHNPKMGLMKFSEDDSAVTQELRVCHTGIEFLHSMLTEILLIFLLGLLQSA